VDGWMDGWMDDFHGNWQKKNRISLVIGGLVLMNGGALWWFFFNFFLFSFWVGKAPLFYLLAWRKLFPGRTWSCWHIRAQKA